MTIALAGTLRQLGDSLYQLAELADITEAPMLTVGDVSGLLRVSRPTVTRLLESQELQGVKVGGQWRVRRQTLEAFMAGRAAS